MNNELKRLSLKNGLMCPDSNGDFCRFDNARAHAWDNAANERSFWIATSKKSIDVARGKVRFWRSMALIMSAQSVVMALIWHFYGR